MCYKVLLYICKPPLPLRLNDIFSMKGALFACCLNGTMDTVFQTALLMPSLKPLLFREYRNGAYALLPMMTALFVVNGVAQNVNIVALSVEPQQYNDDQFINANTCCCENNYCLVFT
jgi:hypothetical protein